MDTTYSIIIISYLFFNDGVTLRADFKRNVKHTEVLSDNPKVKDSPGVYSCKNYAITAKGSACQFLCDDRKLNYTRTLIKNC